MAVDMTLKIDGVDGESVVKGHEGEIDVLSLDWGMTQSGSMHMGPGGGSGKVEVNDISFTKYVDKATPKLMRVCCNGKHLPEALLTIRKAGGEAIDYLKIKMKSVIVSSLQTGASSGDDYIMEHVSFNFAKFECTYTPQEDDGSAGAEIKLNFNIESNVEE